MLTPDDLRAVSLLEDLPDDDLAWIVERAEEVTLRPGEALNEAGDSADWMYLMLEGSARAIVRDGERETAAYSFEAGQVAGVLPRSRMQTYGATARATIPTRLARLHKRHFPDLIRDLQEFDSRLAHLMIDRSRAESRVKLQQEKLVSLGTMAAGLAHELNNPASAAKRAAETLCETLQTFDERASTLLRKLIFPDGLPPMVGGDGAGAFDPGEQGDPFQPVYDVILAPDPDLDPLEEGDREDAFADWFDDLADEGLGQVAQPWEAASTLTAAGFTADFLSGFLEGMGPEFRVDTINWIVQDTAMRALCVELAESTTRISELVGAMKSYTYMDQDSQQQRVNLKRGIIDTVIILKHKFKKKGIRLSKTFGDDVPDLLAYGSELNQVWTNLLDNAIAAVPDEGGEIRLVTSYDDCSGEGGGMVQVDLYDNGSGIPEDLQARIFEPFFTTKGPGEGTGLGLDIVMRIVRHRHGGVIYVESEPGATHFRVRLPVNGRDAPEADTQDADSQETVALAE
ncbi:MAG: ATP-binding protein [Bacteroidota bacterium]